MPNLNSELKRRDITLPTKVRLVKAMVFPVVMYGCESWTIKKAKHWRTDAFELWCWRRLLRVPWTARRSNESILKEISPECSLEGRMWNLKPQHLATWFEELTHLKRPWCWERLKAGGEGNDRGWDGWMALLTQWTWVWVNSGSWWWTGRPGVLWFMGSQRVGHDWATEMNWTEHELDRILVHSLLSCISLCVCSVMSDSLGPHGLWPSRLLYPWDSLGKNTGVGCHALLQRIFTTQGSNLGLLYVLHRQEITNPAGRFFTTHATWEASFHVLSCLIFTASLREEVLFIKAQEG